MAILSTPERENTFSDGKDLIPLGDREVNSRGYVARFNLLDEPANDLDVNTMRALEDALESFGGCSVVISHDRWFLDRIATHILAFEGDSSVFWFEGNYSEYEKDRHSRLGAAVDQPHRIRYRHLTREKARGASIPAARERFFSVDKCTIYWYTMNMKISMDKVEYECGRRGLNTGEMLREAGVSRNAFYCLARKDCVVPTSLIRIAERLDISVSALLEETDTPVERMKSLVAESERISKRYPGVDRDNIRHTLLLLNERPVERLRRALRRGRFVDLW